MGATPSAARPMYYRRLKIFLVLIALSLLIVIGRLVHLQIVRGDHYQQLAEQRLVQPPHYTPTARGEILDRYDRKLATDQPSWNIAVDYRVLAEDRSYLLREARNAQRAGRFEGLTREQAADRIRDHHNELLSTLARQCGVTPARAESNRRDILRRVQTIQDQVSAQHGRRIIVAEQRTAHVVIEDIPNQPEGFKDSLAARLNQEPGFEVVARPKRVYPYERYTAHLVGLVGPVYREDVADDPFADDDLKRYLPDDTKGIAGVERLAEATLRGRRGVRQEDRDGVVVRDEPRTLGRDVRLTIDADLQKQVYNVLARHVAGSPNPCGGSVVVINIGDRATAGGDRLADGDVLAMATYPSFDANNWQRLWRHLVQDRKRLPLFNRPIQWAYPPGSIVKPAVLAGGLKFGHVDAGGTIECTGRFRRQSRHFRCWIFKQYGITHGPLTPREAIMHSCNVYFYKVGDRLGFDDLTGWLGRLGLGQDLHTGLPEQRSGVLPSRPWLAAHRPDLPVPVPADARNMGVGQGELTVTPLQAATMMAAIARGGVYLDPRIVADAPRRPAIDLGIHPSHIQMIHQGMDDVVNDPDGTAYKHARMTTTRLAGKTGSAQASRRKIYIDDDSWYWFPPKDAGSPAHAWFAGFAPADRPTVAVIAQVEYGGSGGKSAGPLARDIVQLCINFDYVPGGPEAKREVGGLMAPPDPVVPRQGEDRP